MQLRARLVLMVGLTGSIGILAVAAVLTVLAWRGILEQAESEGLVIARLLHTWGYSSNPGATYPRLIGAQVTFLLLSIMGFGAIYLSVAQHL